MSLLIHFDKRVDCKRPTTTKDSSGGDVPTFATFTYDADAGATTANLRAQLWPKRLNDTDTSFARPDGLQEIEWAFAVNWGARPGDVVVYDGEEYRVVGNGTHFTHPMAARSLYVVKTHLRRT